MVLNNLTDPLYTPSALVKSCHKIPHLSTHYNSMSSTFDWTTAYYETIVVFPSLIFSITYLLMCTFKAAQLFRRYCHSYWTRIVNYCCGRFKHKRLLFCNPKRSLSAQEESYVFRTNLFYFLCGCLIFINFFIFYGNAGMTKAYHTFSSSANNLENTFADIVDYSAGIVYAANRTQIILPDICTTISGPLYTEMNTNLSLIMEYGDTINANAAPVQTDTQDFLAYFSGFTVHAKDDVAITFFCTVFVVTVWLMLSVQQQSFFYYKIGSVTAWALLLGLAVFSLLFGLAFLMAISDYCMNPVASAGTITGPKTPMFEVLSFYITCSGDSPFQPYLADINSLIVDFNTTLVSLHNSAGVTDFCYTTVEGLLQLMALDASVVGVNIQCPNIYSYWSQFMYSGICDYAFDGLFNIWVVQLLELFVLFFILIVATFSHSAFEGFEEDRATNGALNDWQVDSQSFAPIHVVKLSPEEAAARLQKQRNKGIMSPVVTAKSDDVSSAMEAGIDAEGKAEDQNEAPGASTDGARGKSGEEGRPSMRWSSFGSAISSMFTSPQNNAPPSIRTPSIESVNKEASANAKPAAVEMTESPPRAPSPAPSSAPSPAPSPAPPIV